MVFAFSILLLMSVFLFIMAKRKKDNSHIQGLKTGGVMFLNMIPILLLAFMLAGLIHVAVPPATIQSWLGEEAGWRGIVIGVFAGGLILGGPYAAFPVISSTYKAGASMATVISMITGWALLGVGQLIMGLAFIGLRFTVSRTLVVLILPFLAGVLGWIFF